MNELFAKSQREEVRVIEWVIVAAIILYLAAKALMGIISFQALIFYMLKKEYTPPSPAEMEECRKEIVRHWFNLKNKS